MQDGVGRLLGPIFVGRSPGSRRDAACLLCPANLVRAVVVSAARAVKLAVCVVPPLAGWDGRTYVL